MAKVNTYYDPEFTQLFLDVYGRVPEPGNGWYDAYKNILAENKGDRKKAIKILDNNYRFRFNPETFKPENAVKAAYETYLGRPPTGEELKKETKNMKAYESKEWLKSFNSRKEVQTFKELVKNNYSTLSGNLPKNATPEQKYAIAMEQWQNSGKKGTGMIKTDAPLVQVVKNKEGKEQLRLNPKLSNVLSISARNKYTNLVNQFNGSKGGNYNDLVKLASNLGDKTVVDNFFKGKTKELADVFYSKNKVSKWDAAKNGKQPPTGLLDTKYYSTKDPKAQEQWKSAGNQKIGNYGYKNLDVTSRYGTLDNYLSYRYSTYGKSNNIRGNKAVAAAAAESYKEIYGGKTDAEKALVRNAMEKNFYGSYGKDYEKKELAFSTLALDALKTAQEELTKAKEEEAQLGLYRDMPGFEEVYNSNETIVNSLLGDSGIGGILALGGENTKGIKESLTGVVEKATGLSSNNTIRNWQKWFDETLTKKYENMKSVKIKTKDGDKEIEEEYALDKKDIDDFINNYLTPRFNQSKSMSEFSEYIDSIVPKYDEKGNKIETQNVFQTQTTLNALKSKSEEKAKEYIDSLKGTTSSFNADFYFNPLKTSSKDYSKARKTSYQKQSENIKNDWAKAKKTPNQKIKIFGDKSDLTWNQWAYYYGLDLNKKEDFAKLHYQIIGQIKGYDPAEDVVTKYDIDKNFADVVLPALKKLDKGTAFQKFTTPKEFTDEIFEGLDPFEDKEEWKELAKELGLEEDASLDELRGYVEEAVSGNSALAIRQEIKYLNERDKDLNQLNLGADYIERETDKKELENPSATSIYNIFKKGGYGGTEEEFYNEFMTDLDKEDVALMDKVASGKIGDINELVGDIEDDPFSALASVSSFMGDGDDILGSGTSADSDKKQTGQEKAKSYFDLFSDEKKEEDSFNSGGSMMGSYSSLFG